VSWYQKGKTNMDFIEARESEWQWHQLGHMQVCTSLQADNHASIPLLTDVFAFDSWYEIKCTDGGDSCSDNGDIMCFYAGILFELAMTIKRAVSISLDVLVIVVTSSYSEC